MALIKIDQFHGIAPRTHPTLLGDGMAVTAHNVKLQNGKLVPLKMPSMAQDVVLLLENGLDKIENARSIHAWKKTNGDVEFLLFPGMTWMSEGNLADDDRTRVIVSGDTGVDFTNDDGSTTHNSPQIYMRNTVTGMRFIHPMCKNKMNAPKVKRISSTELDDNRRYTYFFITWVDQYGYESPISDASLSYVEELSSSTGWTLSYDSETGVITASGETERYYDEDDDKIIVTWNTSTTPKTPTAIAVYEEADFEYMDGDDVQIAALGTLPTGADKLRVYKVITGSEEGRIQFIYETTALGHTTSAMNFKVKDEDAGEVLVEIEAPYSDMKCIQDVPGAYYVGFSGTHPKTVCFSEVDLLYSWPTAYQYDIKDNIVALAVTSNTVFALTDGWPYVLSGTEPGGMTVTKLAGPASCVSQRGVCVYKNAVYYVGQQGLMTIYNDPDAGTVCTNLTDKVFTKEQWQEFNPSSCVMGQFDGALHLFFTLSDGTTHKGLSVAIAEGANAVTTHDEVAKCLCVDNKTDKMYYVREG